MIFIYLLNIKWFIYFKYLPLFTDEFWGVKYSYIFYYASGMSLSDKMRWTLRSILRGGPIELLLIPASDPQLE